MISFFFSSRRRHTRSLRDWSSDVCSSDLGAWRDRVLEPLRQQHRVMLDRAIARGEIAASVDRDVVLDLFFGAAEHRLLLGHLPMTGEFIAEVVDVILAGLPRPDRPPQPRS